MNECKIDRICAALDSIASSLAQLAGALDPEELERRKNEMLAQLAKDLAKENSENP